VLACPFKNIRTSTVALTLLVGACFDPDPTPLETESSAETTDGDTTNGMVCTPGDAQDCACPDGGVGTQVCDDAGSGFGSCECEGADSTTTTTDPSTTTDATTGPPPECEVADDCNQADGDCQVNACIDGVCMVESVRDGTECGGPEGNECSAIDTCLRGGCAANDVPNGTACTDCPLGVCACEGGGCIDCAAFAPENNFVTTRSIAGWTLTGGWGLYRQAPQSQSSGPTVFGSQVFGTDGNRLAPYPGSEAELSSARSGPVTLPATLEFLSWNVDEGSGFDTKQINVSLDGGASFMTLFDCGGGGGQPFCQFRDDTRAPDDWDAISIPVPPEFVGNVGIVELTYNTGDGCCGFEKGWFIDVTNFATECACADDGVCGGLGGECGEAICGATGECELDAVAAGMACGDAADVQCNDPDACDGTGYCAPNVAPNGLTTCEDCAAGIGSCNACQEGTCVDCATLVPNDFGAGVPAGWIIESLSGSTADWQIYSSAPQSQVAGSTPTPLSFAPSFGTDGNRQAPYPGAENEHSRITTVADVVPAQITFSSWNVDEGSGVDNKIIEVSVDGGASWNVLVDCGGGIGGAPAFCMFRQDPRAGDEWDDIVIDTAAFAGQVGQLRFTYNTLDSCCNFERGWFIDNLNFGQFCADSPFP
jgi:hypothetical protein